MEDESCKCGNPIWWDEKLRKWFHYPVCAEGFEGEEVFCEFGEAIPECQAR